MSRPLPKITRSYGAGGGAAPPPSPDPPLTMRNFIKFGVKVTHGPRKKPLDLPGSRIVMIRWEPRRTPHVAGWVGGRNEAFI